MANLTINTFCNGCKNLDTIIEGKKELKHVKFKCIKYKVEVKITDKIFKDHIISYSKCNGKDYIQK